MTVKVYVKYTLLKSINYVIVVLCLISSSSSSAYSCPNRLRNYLDYQRRNAPNNRCEGLIRQNISSFPQLISFVTHRIHNTSNDYLTLKVYNVGEVPTLLVQSYRPRYKIDQFNLNPQSSWYTFNLSTNLLRQADVSLSNLRFLATRPNSPRELIPVLLEPSSGKYEFVFYSYNRTDIEFKIYKGNQIIAEKKLPNPERGEIKFIWDGRNQSAGLYELRLSANLHYLGQESQLYEPSYSFHHNPDWLQ